MNSQTHTVGKYKYIYEKGTGRLAQCPGLYCGRTLFSNGTYSDCGSCPRGFRRDSTYECRPCGDELERFDWLYLGFMALLPILLHLTSIDNKRLNNKDTIGLVLCALVEISISSILTIFFFADPFGTFQIKSCTIVHELSDWYPIFYNPYPNYDETVFCSHEAVYPRYTMVIIFYALSDFMMVFTRLIASTCGIRVSKSIYNGLYFYPLLTLAHLVFGGLIYNIFPYITIITSVISCAYHFAKRTNQEFKKLLIESVTDWRNIGIILFHWFLHAYGIISTMELQKFKWDFWLLNLVPVPALLYIFTVNFTDPGKLHGD